MRRVLLVTLVVFVAGLAALLAIDRATREEPAEPEEPPPAVQQPGIDQGPGERVPLPDDEGAVTEVAVSGPLRLSDVDPQTRVRRYEFRARDSRSRESGRVEAEGIELEAFGESGEVVDRRVLAARGQLQVAVSDGPPRIDETTPIVLEEVSARLASGLEFAPLDLTIPRLEARLGTRTLRSEEALVVTGRGLAARGQGLFADGVASLMRIEREPHVELELEDGARATLDATGPLTLADRPDLGPGLATVTAEGGARLTLESAEPLEVTAPLVRLIGRVEDDPERFVPLRAEAEGGVELRPREGRFLAERAEFEFGPEGLAQRGRLVGSPRFELDLRGADLSGIGGEQEIDTSSSLPVEGQGASELVLAFGERATFALDGPAQVRMPTLDAVVDSDGPLTGSAEEGLGYGTIEASGGVRVRSGELELEAPRILVEALGQGDEEAFARLTTEGLTRARGPDEAGRRRFELTARRGLVATRRGESYAVPRAEDVELRVLGELPLLARADRLLELDGTTLAFEARGDVELEEARGSGTGERLVAHGRDHAELFGRPGEPATLRRPEGELSAGRIEAFGQRLAADGDAHLTVDIEGLQADLRSRWLQAGPGTPLEGPDPAPPADWALDAGGDVRAVVVTGGARHELSSDLLRLEANEELQPDGGRELAPAGLQARGSVEARYVADLVLRARGEVLTYDARGFGRLQALLGDRVDVEGELPERGVRFTLTANALDYGLDQLSVEAADIVVEGLDLPLLGEEVTDVDPRLSATAGHLLVDRSSMLFSERVVIRRVSGSDISWSLDAERVQLVGSGAGGAGGAEGLADPASVAGALDDMYAWGGFVASSADGLQVLGDRLHVSRLDDRVTAQGSPAAVVGRGVRWESEWFELDRTRRSIKAAAGQVRSTVEGARAWSMRYASLEPEVREDETIQVLREPVLVSGDEELRASWALFWIDRAGWGQDLDEGDRVVTGERRARPRMRSLFGELLRFDGLDWLRAVYLEGNIAYTLEGDGKAQAQAIYVDLQDGQGWVRDISLQSRTPFTRDRTPMKLRADWLRHSADGSYTAVGAVATTCEHEEPHYVIRIGDLRITPRSEERAVRDPATGEEVTEEEFTGWEIVARENQLRLWRDVGLPLPKIDVPVDEKYRVETDDVSVLGLRPLSFGNDAKFGAFVGTTFSVDLSWLADAFDWLVSGIASLAGDQRGPGVQAGRADVNARWLNGRNGLLLGVQVPFYSPGRYWIDVMADGIFDDGEDRGLVRVPEDERDLWRGWYHARGRYLLGEREWVDVVGTFQSDPGFQAEYFEGDYLRFEERESFLHYRKADGDRGFAATVEADPQRWRTEVVDQPRMSFYDGRSRVASLGPIALLYGWSADAGRIVRVEGSGGYEPPFPDGLGEREVLRFDTRHRLETPVDLTLAGLRATPYLEGRFTAWDQGADEDEQPARAGLLAGAELSTTLFRAFRGGSRHAISPWVGVRTDLATVDDDVALVPLDRTELPLEGTLVDMGIRSRWTHSERPDTLDIELAITHGNDVPDAARAGTLDGWLPLRTRGVWYSTLLGIPYVVSHDGRYDLDDQQTEYSRALLAFEPIPPVDIELGHHFGRDPQTQRPLYEAVTLGAIWRFSTKWEIEGRQTLSNQGDGRLAYGLLLRRLGHDFVFEVETRFVAGEGESFGFRLTPLILWDPSGFSLLDRTRREPW